MEDMVTISRKQLLETLKEVQEDLERMERWGGYSADSADKLQALIDICEDPQKSFDF